ncbi:hypothetical protein QYF36_004490 [Acer negundo]|nr:hypothetical protein QYF36_004490 [Acer negundo]
MGAIEGSVSALIFEHNNSSAWAIHFDYALTAAVYGVYAFSMEANRLRISTSSTTKNQARHPRESLFKSEAHLATV